MQAAGHQEKRFADVALSREKIAATLAILLVGLALAVPSFFSPEQRKGFLASLPPWFPHWIVPTRAIVLGPRSQGGSQLLLEVDHQNDLVASQAKSLRDDVRRVLQQESVRAEAASSCSSAACR